jgi:hypothetical protein
MSRILEKILKTTTIVGLAGTICMGTYTNVEIQKLDEKLSTNTQYTEKQVIEFQKDSNHIMQDFSIFYGLGALTVASWMGYRNVKDKIFSDRLRDLRPYGR